MQLLFEVNTIIIEVTNNSGNPVPYIFIKMGIRNAFNELSRTMIRKFLTNNKHVKHKFSNHLLAQYRRKTRVDFGNGINSEMKNSTHQGCKHQHISLMQ